MNGHGNGRGGYAGAYTGRGGRGSGGRGSRSRAGRGGGSGAWSVGPPSTDTIHVDLTSTGAQLSPVPDEPVGATEPFKPPTRLDIRKASVFDFVPSSPNSARAKRSPKSSSYATRYDNRINSPGSLMSPKSEAGALVGAPARDESTDEAKWRMRVEPRVVVLVDGVLAALRKAAGSAAHEAQETESDNSIAGGLGEDKLLARRCFFLLLESQIVDLHYHSRLFVLLCGNVYMRLKRAAGGLLTAAATPEGFRIQAVQMASALAAYQSYRHHRRRFVDEALYDLDSEIAQRQAVMEATAAQEKGRATSEMKDLLMLCLQKRRVVLGVVQDGVARADGEELLNVKAKLTRYVDGCASSIEGYSSPQPGAGGLAQAPAPAPAPMPDAKPDGTETQEQTSAEAAEGDGDVVGLTVPSDAKTEAEAAQEARRLHLEMELRKLDEARQAVVARLNSIEGSSNEDNDDAPTKDDTEKSSPATAALAASSPSGDLSPSHSSGERIGAAVAEAVKETLREMLRWEVLQIDESLCRATMQYLKFNQMYLQRRSRASEMLMRRLAMCSARFDTLIESAQKGLNPPTPVSTSEISPPTPRSTSASPETRKGGEHGPMDPTGTSELFGLPVSRAEALKECKKQKRMVSETSRQLKKILFEWDEIFIIVTDFTEDLGYLPGDYKPRRDAEEVQRKLLRDILELIQAIRKALATHANRDRPKMSVHPDDHHGHHNQHNVRFNPSAAVFNPSATAFVPGGGFAQHHGPPMMMMPHHGPPMPGQPGVPPGFFPGMAQMVMVGSPQMESPGGGGGGDYGGGGYRASDTDSVASDSSDWSTQSPATSDFSDHASITRPSGAQRALHHFHQQAQADLHAAANKSVPRGRPRRRRASNPDISLSELEGEEDEDGFCDGELAVDVADGNGHGPALVEGDEGEERESPAPDSSAETTTEPSSLASPSAAGTPASEISGDGGSSSPGSEGDAKAKARGAALLSLVADPEGGDLTDSGQVSPGAASVSSTSSVGSNSSRSKVRSRSRLVCCLPQPLAPRLRRRSLGLNTHLPS